MKRRANISAGSPDSRAMDIPSLERADQIGAGMAAGAAGADRRSRSDALFRTPDAHASVLSAEPRACIGASKVPARQHCCAEPVKSYPGDILNPRTFDDPRGGFRLVRGHEVIALSGPVRGLCAGHDGRQYRARDQLLGGVPEIPFTRAGGLCGAVALASVPAVFGRRRLAGRPVRSAPYHPVRDAALHRGVGGMGILLHHRHA